MAKRIGRVKSRRGMALVKLSTGEAGHLRKQSRAKFLHPALSRSDLAGHADYHRKAASKVRLLAKGGRKTAPSQGRSAAVKKSWRKRKRAR